MSQWKWNNVQLQIDMNDADFIEKYENAFETLEQTEIKLQNIGKCSDFVRKYCTMFYQLFDDIFGQGTGQKLFEGKHNARIVEEAYDSFIAHVKKEVDAANKQRFNNVKKYKVSRK